MNILFYQHQYPAFGGIETVTTLLARKFIEEGHCVRIVSFIAKSGTKLLDRLPAKTWLQLPNSAIEAPENVLAVSQCLEDFRPHVIVFQDSYAKIEEILFECVGRCRKHNRATIVAVEHSMPRIVFPYRLRLKNARDVFRDLAIVFFAPVFIIRSFMSARFRRRRILARADAYVLLSTRYFSSAICIAGCRHADKMLSIPNPIPAKVRAFADCAKGKDVIFCGSLIRCKCVDKLLQIWAKIESRFMDWRFVIVGDGEERENLERLSGCLGLQRVFFEGFKTNVVPYYSRASIIVMASDFEGWPMVLGEAMQYGCVPVVYNTFLAAGDLLSDGRVGALIPAGAKDEFVLRLSNLMSNEKLLSVERAKASARARDFDIKEVSRRWNQLFNELRRV